MRSSPLGATVAFFVTGLAAIPLDLAVKRVFARITEAGGTVRGATSVAVQTR